jgi:hypothetical protein
MSPKAFKKEKITKEDGRYVIFYTFDEESGVDRPETSDQRPETRARSPERGAQSRDMSDV